MGRGTEGQGIHARSGVACADCQMSYRRDGAQKISEHWVRSPLLSANRSCATCHPYSDEELKGRVEAIQDRHFALMTRAGQAAVAMIDAIVAVRTPYDERNRTAASAKAKETLEKTADFQKLAKEDQEKKLAAENSMGFHAPQEMARILGESIDMSRQAQFKAGEVLHGKVAVAALAAPVKAAGTMSK
jgi:nitrite reductase (cytochrome c-552)